MVVENTRDLAAYEKTGRYDGVYHVLHGAISPMLGIGPKDIRLTEPVSYTHLDVYKRQALLMEPQEAISIAHFICSNVMDIPPIPVCLRKL